jgi:hypothetical protein
MSAAAAFNRLTKAGVQFVVRGETVTAKPADLIT